eukprot:2795690-Rhodomonas_salina.1
MPVLTCPEVQCDPPGLLHQRGVSNPRLMEVAGGLKAAMAEVDAMVEDRIAMVEMGKAREVRVRELEEEGEALRGEIAKRERDREWDKDREEWDLKALERERRKLEGLEGERERVEAERVQLALERERAALARKEREEGRMEEARREREKEREEARKEREEWSEERSRWRQETAALHVR